MSENSNDRSEESLVSVRTMDIVTAALFILLGVVIMIGSINLGNGWGSDGPEAGYFPFYVSLIMTVASGFTLYKALIVDKQEEQESFVARGPFKQVLSVLLPAAVFVLGIQLIGIYVSGWIYITVFMRWLGKYPLWKSIAVGLGVSIALYMLFEVWFQVPLPNGSLINPLAIIGVQ
uniref:tripartite tricarboxylate transporter TctB family protein n=1 Tax=Polynucleobacter sp. TaxID=2029855 RepID=UPI004047B896